jgi:hypothetical protein
MELMSAYMSSLDKFIFVSDGALLHGNACTIDCTCQISGARTSSCEQYLDDESCDKAVVVKFFISF